MTWARQTIQRPNGWSRGFEDDMAWAVTAAMTEAAILLRDDLREATWHANGWKNALPKTWRARTFPRGQNSVDATAWVDTRAPRLMKIFAEGAVITARGGKWLAIPTEAAGRWGLKAGSAFGATVNQRGNRERITPQGFMRRTGMKLRFVAGKGALANRRAVLVVDNAKRTRRTLSGGVAPYGPGRGAKLYGPSGQTIVVFILVRRVALKQKLDVPAVARVAQGRVPGLISKYWSRRA